MKQLLNLDKKIDDVTPALIDLIPYGIDIIDESGKILFANEYIKKLFGKKVIGKNCWEIYHSEKKQCNNCPLKNNFEVGKTKVCKTTEFVDTRIYEIRFTNIVINGINATLRISNDITQQKADEEEIYKNEKRLQEIFDNMQDAYFQSDPSGNISFVNLAAIKMYGCDSIDELIGEKTSILYAHLNDRNELINKLCKYGKLTDWTTQGRKKDGSTFWASINVQYIYDESGNITGIQGIIRNITERLITELNLNKNKHKLKESKILLQTLIDSTCDFIWSVDMHSFGLISFNKALADFCNNICNIDIKAGMTPSEILPTKELTEKCYAFYNKAIREGTVINEYKVPDTDIYLLINLNPLKKDNEVFGISGFAKNITERKRAELELMKAKNKAEEDARILSEIKNELQQREIILSNVEAITHTGGWEFDLRTRKRYFTQELYQILEVPMNTDFEFLDSVKSHNPEVRILISSVFQHCVQDGTPYDLTVPLLSYKGNEKWVRTKAMPVLDDGHVIKVIGSFVDVTEQIKNETELLLAKQKAEENEKAIRKQQEELTFYNECLESLLHLSQLSSLSSTELFNTALHESIKLTKSQVGFIYLYDEKTRQLTLNTWSKDVMINCSVETPRMVCNLDDTGCYGDAIRQRKPIVMNDYKAPNPNKKGLPEGHLEIFRFLTIPVILDDKIVAMAGVANKESDYDQSDIRQLSLLMDTVWKISERVNLIDDLVQAKQKAEESDRLKSAFLMNISHEIRTPMNGILGFMEFLNQPELSEEDKSEYLNIMNKSGERLMNTINDIVEISKIEIGDVQVKYEKIDVSDLIKYYYNFFKIQAKEKKLSFKITNQIQGESAIIISDRHKLDEILANLIKNALKFTDKGGIEIGNYLQDDMLCFYVTDTGRGIPEDKQSIIFDRFVQADIGLSRSYEGSGIGLSIVKAYVEALSGQIEVKSSVGTGSTFLVYIPYLPATDKPEHDKTINDTKIESAKHTLLIAEDDEVNYYLLEKILIEEFELIHASNGEEAVELFRNNPGISLVLMDIKMPGEFNGIEAARKIRKINETVPIIAQTAHAMDFDKKEAFEAGYNDYIAKPFKSKHLLSQLRKYIIAN